MVIKVLEINDAMWESVANYADECSWSAGKNIARRMRAYNFSEWERVIIALSDNQIAGYCTVIKTDCIPDVPYTPYISSMFVGEQFRGNRLSEKLINFALVYLRNVGFESAYLVSDHVNLYEKYGFVKIDEKPAPWNPDTMETIFMHLTEQSTGRKNNDTSSYH